MTPDDLAAAERYVTRAGAADLLETLGLRAYYGHDSARRDSHGLTPQRGRRNVPRIPDELLDTVTVPAVPGGRAIVS